HVGMSDHFAPVGGSHDVTERGGGLFRMHRTAAHGRHLEAEAELERDLFGVLGQNGEGPRTPAAQAHGTDLEFLHSLYDNRAFVLNLRIRALVGPRVMIRAGFSHDSMDQALRPGSGDGGGSVDGARTTWRGGTAGGGSAGGRTAAQRQIAAG